jgi:hypothetical protein
MRFAAQQVANKKEWMLLHPRFVRFCQGDYQTSGKAMLV